MRNLNIKELNSATAVITGGPGTGTFLIKKAIQEQCANGTQCIVFSLSGEYKKECENLGGAYITVTEDFDFNNFNLPANCVVVYDFKELTEDNARQPFKDLLRKVYEAIKSDTEKPKCVELDISKTIYDYTYGLWSYMADNLRMYNAMLAVAYQE